MAAIKAIWLPRRIVAPQVLHAGIAAQRIVNFIPNRYFKEISPDAHVLIVRDRLRRLGGQLQRTFLS